MEIIKIKMTGLKLCFAQHKVVDTWLNFNNIYIDVDLFLIYVYVHEQCICEKTL